MKLVVRIGAFIVDVPPGFYEPVETALEATFQLSLVNFEFRQRKKTPWRASPPGDRRVGIRSLPSRGPLGRPRLPANRRRFKVAGFAVSSVGDAIVSERLKTSAKYGKQ
jgi:hypothetical protein